MSQNYDLSRLNILVADDCPFFRRTMATVLRIMRVGKLYLASDGGEAIDIIKNSVKESAVRGQSNIDMVMSDWYMEPIDGAMFLRWIRRSPDSPDRYMPFIAMSGAVDNATVNEARDLGVTEFLAKPFSVNNVSRHLVRLIDQPRQFVFNGHYFGPDRRRKPMPFEGRDKRIMNPDNIEVVYTGKKPENLNAEAKVWYFRLPNMLKGKFSSSSDGSSGGRIDPNLLDAAEAQLMSMEDDYTDWVRQQIDEMHKHYEALQNNPVNPWRHLKAINKMALQLRGQGGTFGYNLITDFGKSLYEYTNTNREITDNLLEMIKAHFDAITAVLRDKIRGTGGRIGEELNEILQMALEKYHQSTKSNDAPAK